MIPEATELTTIKPVRSRSDGVAGDGLADQKYYVLEDRKGIWRRITTKAARENAIAVTAATGEGEDIKVQSFVRDRDFDAAAEKAGFVLDKPSSSEATQDGECEYDGEELSAAV